MKKIGFIDYYISEWHANNYPLWIKEVCEESGKEFKVAYAYAELDKSPVDGRTTDEWCEAFGVEKCDTIEELCEKSDYIMILSPSDPETHLRYAEAALKFGKNTYIDKTFAPDYSTAKKIFDIAEKYGTKFFSTSALRCAPENDSIKNCVSAVLTGGGENFDEYIIHEIERAVKIMGIGAKRVKVESQTEAQICRIDYGDGKTATLVYSYALPAAAAYCDADGNRGYVKIESDFFRNLMRKIIEFYESGKPFFDVNETLEVMKIREKLIQGKEKDGKWIAI